MRRAGRVYLQFLHRAQRVHRQLRRQSGSHFPNRSQALYLRRRHRQGSAGVLHQHQGAGRDPVRHRNAHPVPRSGQRGAGLQALGEYPLQRQLYLPNLRPAAVLHQRVQQRLHPVRCLGAGSSPEERADERFAACAGHPFCQQGAVLRDPRPHAGDLGRPQRAAVQYLAQKARH